MARRYTDEEKQKIVSLVSKSPLPIKEACKHYGVSSASFYVWRKALEEADTKEDAAAKQPDETPEAQSDPVAERVVALKQAKPYLGLLKISKQLLREGFKVSARQVDRILADHGIDVRNRVPKAPPKGSRRFERLNPNDLWMMDIMYYRLRKDGRFYVISVLDDYSRFIAAHAVATTQTADNVIEVLQTAIEAHGLPRQVLTDRGGQFHSWSGFTRFEELLDNLGVEHIVASPQSPQTIGKIESWHRNIQRELLRQKEFETVEAAKEAIAGYVEYYNHERVHAGIHYLTPADRYFGIRKEVEKLMTSPHPDPNTNYLIGRIDGQPIRLQAEGDGTLGLYLAGHKKKSITDLTPLKTWLTAT